LAAHAVKQKRLQGLCIGYGCVDVDDIARAVRLMEQALRRE
jgi:hypothetical protein